VRSVELPAEPAPLTLDLERTALIVVDMQNAFASPGGMLDLAGLDIGPARDVIANARMVCEAARGAGIQVVYLTIGYPPDLSTAGGPDSPNPRKELALCLMRERPELRGKLLTFGTWDFQIVEELAPLAGDVVIVKSRYSGFFATNLDSMLRSRGVRNLLMVADATMAAGPAEIQRATVYNVRTFFGWVAASEDVATALRESAGKGVE